MLPALVDPQDLQGAVVAVIDLLRASTTVTHAIAAGADRLVVCATPEHAREIAGGLEAGSVLLGGERKGVRISGFQLGNSPREYTRSTVQGKTVVYTTTNGTVAALHARQAAMIVFGCLANLGAVTDVLRKQARPVHFLCAGTNGRIAQEDVLCAGAMVERLARPHRRYVFDDSAMLARNAWAGATESGLRKSVAASIGGSGLIKIGFGPDIALCLRTDSKPYVGVFEPCTGEVRGIDQTGYISC